MIVLDIRMILLAVFFACIIIADIFIVLIKVTKFIICRNVQDCKNRKCLVSETCKKYNSKLTKEECEELIELVNNIREEQ